MKVSLRNRNLIEKYGGKEVPFPELPDEAKHTIVQYEIGDGRDPEWIDEMLADDRIFFGLVHIPIWELRREIMKDDGIAESFSEFDAYHKWFTAAISTYSDRADNPLVLSEHSFETLADGFERLCYYHDMALKDKRYKQVPCVYYVN